MVDDNRFNFGFEKIDQSSKPMSWKINDDLSSVGYEINVDSQTKYDGKYSLSICKMDNECLNTFGIFSYTLPIQFGGKAIKLQGYIKTLNVSNGYASLFMKTMDCYGNIRYKYIQNEKKSGIIGTNSWKKYIIEIPFDSNSSSVTFGAVLNGSGKAWFDNLQVYIDDINISKIKTTRHQIDKARLDTFYRENSMIDKIELSPVRIKELANLGELWGFLKYYHPKVASGDINWDAVLFRLMSKTLTLRSTSDVYSAYEKLVDSLGAFSFPENAVSYDKGELKSDPHIGLLFKQGNLPPSLLTKIQRIKQNYRPPPKHYYVDFNPEAGNPVFKNEIDYETLCPDAGLRLLTLFRYWNIIQYFYPYRSTIKDWDKVLSEFIPRFVNVVNRDQYVLVCLELITRIRDSHSGYVSNCSIVDTLKGLNIFPVRMNFIEGKLVATGYYSKMETGIGIDKGDVINKIDDTPVQNIVKKYLYLTPGSNYESQLRDLCSCNGFLLRSNKTVRKVQIIHNGSVKNISVRLIKLCQANKMLDFEKEDIDSAYKLLPNNIGYIYPPKLNESDFLNLKNEFANTIGIIIDLRFYPAVDMQYTYAEWLKDYLSPFAKFTYCKLALPGATFYGNTVFNGKSQTNYKGKILLIVNQNTQSNGEFVAMALSTAKNSLVMGNRTAGADGNISKICLPGKIVTYFSGIGVYYPDGSETQHGGIRIQKWVTPTVNGVKKGKDELLEQAIKIISSE
jgi:hypothetical protein